MQELCALMEQYMKRLPLLEYIKIIHPLETLVIIAAPITPQEIIIAIIPTTIKTIVYFSYDLLV